MLAHGIARLFMPFMVDCLYGDWPCLLWLGVTNLTALFAGGLELSPCYDTGQARPSLHYMKLKERPRGIAPRGRVLLLHQQLACCGLDSWFDQFLHTSAATFGDGGIAHPSVA